MRYVPSRKFTDYMEPFITPASLCQQWEVDRAILFPACSIATFLGGTNGQRIHTVIVGKAYEWKVALSTC